MLDILAIMSGCSSPVIGVMLSISKRILTLLQIAAPIVLITSLTIKFIKLVFNPEDKKGTKPIVNSIIAAILLFFVPAIVNMSMSLMDNSFSLSACWNSIDSNTTLSPNYIPSTSKGKDRSSIFDGTGEYQQGDPAYSDKNRKRNRSGNAGSGVDITNTENGLHALNYNGWDYYLYVPEVVDSKKPLMVFMHGNYTQGHDLNKLLVDGGFASHLKNGTKYKTYVLMPQLPSGDWIANMPKLMNLIDYTIEQYGISKDRISISGFSMGANDVPYVVNAHPEYFSSAVIMSIQWVSQAHINTLKQIPVRIYYGVSDPYAGGCNNLYNALKNAGGDVEIYKYQNQGHAYLPKRVLDDTDSNVMDWVLSQSRG